MTEDRLEDLAYRMNVVCDIVAAVIEDEDDVMARLLGITW